MAHHLLTRPATDSCGQLTLRTGQSPISTWPNDSLSPSYIWGPEKARTVLPTPGHLPADVSLGTILGDLLALIIVDGPLLACSTTRLHQVLGGACGLQRGAVAGFQGHQVQYILQALCRGTSYPNPHPSLTCTSSLSLVRKEALESLGTPVEQWVANDWLQEHACVCV